MTTRAIFSRTLARGHSCCLKHLSDRRPSRGTYMPHLIIIFSPQVVKTQGLKKTIDCADDQREGRQAKSSVIPFLVPRRKVWITTRPGDGQTSCKVWLASVERRRCSRNQDAKPVEICWDAPNPPIDLSR